VQAHDGQLAIAGTAILPDAAHPADLGIADRAADGRRPQVVRNTVHEVSSRSRLNRLRLCFSRLRADAFLVSHLPNIQYLCGFTGSAALLLVESSGSTLYTDGGDASQAREEVASARVTIAKLGLIHARGRDWRPRRARRRLAY